jgi:hypothetical protein
LHSFPFVLKLMHCSHFQGIGGAGVVAIYKLAYPELQKGSNPTGIAPNGGGGGGTRFKSDAIFEEIKERAGQVRRYACDQ